MKPQKNPQHFAVIGLGGFGFHLATALANQGSDVLAIDIEIDRIEEIKQHVTRAICLDSTKQENLLAIAAQELDIAIVTIGENDVEASILTTALLSRLGVSYLISRASNDLHEEILKMVGAHEVINPEKDLAQRLAKRVTKRGLLDLFELSDDGYALSELNPPEEFYGKSLTQLNLRQNYGLNVVAIKRSIRKFEADGTEREVEETQHNPGPNALIQPGDILLCIGRVEDIEKLATQ